MSLPLEDTELPRRMAGKSWHRLGAPRDRQRFSLFVPAQPWGVGSWAGSKRC